MNHYETNALVEGESDSSPMIACSASLSPEALFEQYRKLVLKRAYGLTANVQDAEDITQEVFLKVFLAFQKGNIKHSGNLMSWLSTITRNCAYDVARHEKTLPPCVSLDAQVSQEDDETTSFLNLLIDSDPEIDPERLLLAYEQSQEMHTTIKAALDTLPEAQRYAMLLWIHGLSPKCASTRVKTQIWRGRERFQAAYQQLQEQAS